MATDDAGARIRVWVRGVIVFVVILIGLAVFGWVIWNNHTTASRAETNTNGISHLQVSQSAEQRELRAALHALAVLQRQSASSNCATISATNASMRAAVHDLTQQLPITPDLKPDAVRLREQSNAQKALIRAVFTSRFAPVHYDGHHCTTTKGAR